MPYSDQEIDTRANFLKEVAQKALFAIEKALFKQERLSGKALRNVIGEISLSEEKLKIVSRLYYKHLHKYKVRHEYYRHDKLVGRDKIAALTALAILEVEPFEVTKMEDGAKYVSTLPTRLANEIFAMLFSLVVIKAPPKNVPPLLYESFLHNMGKMNEHLHDYQAAIRRKPDRLNCTVEWMICAFKCMGLKYGDLDIRIDDGD